MDIYSVKCSTPEMEDLFYLADPSPSMIKSYLDKGTCLVGKQDEMLIGVLAWIPLNMKEAEIKNVAIKEKYQNKGYGKEMLHFAFRELKKQKYTKVWIGTGNSSIGQLALYQKLGFRLHSIKKNFFTDNYVKPIYENGIRCRDMIMLNKTLG